MGWSQVNSEGGGGNRQDLFVTTGEKPKRVHILLEKGEEPLSYFSHWIQKAKRSVICPGKSTCPACKANIKAKMNHAVNVYDYDEKKVKVLEKGNTVYEPIKVYYEMGGNSLDNIDVIIKCIGKGRDTNYVVASLPVTSVPPTDVDRHDLKTICAPASADEIAKIMGDSADDFPTDDEPEDTLDGPSPNSGVDTSDVEMPTGKYKGKTLASIAKVDRRYVEWVAENFNDEDIKSAAIEALGGDTTKTPPPESPKLKVATNLVEDFQKKGGKLQAVAQIMRSMGNKTMLLKSFKEEELDAFIDQMKDAVESLQYSEA